MIQFIVHKAGNQAEKIHTPHESKQDSTQEPPSGQEILIDYKCICIQYTSNGLHKAKLPQVKSAICIKLQCTTCKTGHNMLNTQHASQDYINFMQQSTGFII